MSKKSKVQEMDETLGEQQSVDATELNGEEVTEKAENVEELSKEDELREELAKEKDKFLRLFAEFENFKKRTSKERGECGRWNKTTATGHGFLSPTKYAYDDPMQGQSIKLNSIPEFIIWTLRYLNECNTKLIYYFWIHCGSERVKYFTILEVKINIIYKKDE